MAFVFKGFEEWVLLTGKVAVMLFSYIIGIDYVIYTGLQAFVCVRV